MATWPARYMICLGAGNFSRTTAPLEAIRAVDAVPVVAFVFALGDFELIDEPMQITARDAQSARALRLAPAAFAQRAKQQPALELANFFFVGGAIESGLVASAANRGGQMPDIDASGLRRAPRRAARHFRVREHFPASAYSSSACSAGCEKRFTFLLNCCDETCRK